METVSIYLSPKFQIQSPKIKKRIERHILVLGIWNLGFILKQNNITP